MAILLPVVSRLDRFRLHTNRTDLAVPDSFNPYREWLGLDAVPKKLDYYQLLGLERDAAPERVKRAADYAINRVRSVHPGKHTAAWSRLIDELRTAQTVLTDPERRAVYDAKLSSLDKTSSKKGSRAETKTRRTSETQPESRPAPVQPTRTDAGHGSPSTNQPAPVRPVHPVHATPVQPVHSAPVQPVHPAPVQPGVGHPPAPYAPYYPAAPVARVYAPWSSAGGQGGAPGPQPGPQGYADPMAPVSPVGGYSPQPTAPTPGSIPYARPVSAPSGYPGSPVPAAAPVHGVAPVHAAAQVYPAGSAGAPAGFPGNGGAPSVDPIGAPVPVKVKAPRRRRRRGGLLQTLVIGGVAVALVGAVVWALVVGFENAAVDELVSGRPLAKGKTSPSLPVAVPEGEQSSQPRETFVPPPKSDLPPLPGQPPEMSPDDGPMSPGAMEAAPDTPTPSSTSSSPAPEPQGPPTEAEQAQTAQAVQAAMTALREQNFNAADAQLAGVESLPKTEEDQARFAGAKQLAQGARAFSNAVQQGFQNLKPDQQLSFNNTTVKVLEASPESVSIEVVPGVVKKYTAETLPLGLMYGLVNAVIPTDDPANPLAKAAYHATHPDGQPSEVDYFLNEAQTVGAEVEGVRVALNASAASDSTVATNNGSATSDPASQPTPAELQQLTELAQTALMALSERNLDEADAAIAQAEPLAKMPEHKRKIAGLKMLAYYTREFWRAVDESLKTLSEVGELTINNTAVGVVESRPNHLVIRVAGQNRRYTRNEMPDGLAMAVANAWLNEGEPASLAAKGALYAVAKKGDPAKARQLWQQASQRGLDTSLLMTTLEEDYDFTK